MSGVGKGAGNIFAGVWDDGGAIRAASPVGAGNGRRVAELGSLGDRIGVPGVKPVNISEPPVLVMVKVPRSPVNCQLDAGAVPETTLTTVSEAG